MITTQSGLLSPSEIARDRQCEQPDPEERQFPLHYREKYHGFMGPLPECIWYGLNFTKSQAEVIDRVLAPRRNQGMTLEGCFVAYFLELERLREELKAAKNGAAS